jgi:hypothetical protein
LNVANEKNASWENTKMCDRCEKLDAKIERLKQRAESAGPDMLPAIELLIALIARSDSVLNVVKRRVGASESNACVVAVDLASLQVTSIPPVFVSA